MTLNTEKKIYEKLSVSRVTLLLSVHLLAVVAFFNFSFLALFSFLFSYSLIGCLGLTVGYHRLLTHKSFKASSVLRNFLTFLGVLTLQGGPTLWVATHRTHHLMTDEIGDPHSSRRGFFWSHIGWMLHRMPNGFRFSEHSAKASDVANNNFISFLDRYYLLVNIVVPFLVYLLCRRWDVVLWMFPLRIVFFWHATWLVNSFAHQAERQMFIGKISARNSLWLSIIMFGEGWHYNHHKYPASATFQAKRTDFDPGYWSILLFKKLKLATLN